jgi:hypothetical protein
MDNDEKRGFTFVDKSRTSSRWGCPGAKYVHREGASRRGCRRRESVSAQFYFPRVVDTVEWDTFSVLVLRGVGV